MVHQFGLACLTNVSLTSSQTETIQGPSVPVVLDVIREVQLDRLRPEELRDGGVLSDWFMGRLRPFLSSASPGFLRCVSSKELSCNAYQHVSVRICGVGV